MNYFALAGLMLAVVASGCIGGGNGNIAVPQTQGESGDWCEAGQTWQSLNPATGERVQFEIEGERAVEGRNVCSAVWETNANNTEEVARMQMLFNEDGSYTKITLYSSNGSVIEEIETQN